MYLEENYFEDSERAREAVRSSLELIMEWEALAKSYKDKDQYLYNTAMIRLVSFHADLHHELKTYNEILDAQAHKIDNPKKTLLQKIFHK